MILIVSQPRDIHVILRQRFGTCNSQLVTRKQDGSTEITFGRHMQRPAHSFIYVSHREELSGTESYSLLHSLFLSFSDSISLFAASHQRSIILLFAVYLQTLLLSAALFWDLANNAEQPRKAINTVLVISSHTVIIENYIKQGLWWFIWFIHFWEGLDYQYNIFEFHVIFFFF